ncbi:hypothetical protein B296_00044255, partial [Ensete ventricosum]
CEVEFRSIFCATFQKFKILVILNVLLAHGKSYEHGLMKKYDGHKLCAKSRVNQVLIDFSCSVSKIQNTGHSHRISPWEVVQAQFYEKCDIHKLYAKSRANRVSIGFSCNIS